MTRYTIDDRSIDRLIDTRYTIYDTHYTIYTIYDIRHTTHDTRYTMNDRYTIHTRLIHDIRYTIHDIRLGLIETIKTIEIEIGLGLGLIETIKTIEIGPIEVIETINMVNVIKTTFNFNFKETIYMINNMKMQKLTYRNPLGRD